jgi:hypothetical protein
VGGVDAHDVVFVDEGALAERLVVVVELLRMWYSADKLHRCRGRSAPPLQATQTPSIMQHCSSSSSTAAVNIP